MSKCQSRANWHALTFNRDGNERDEIYEKKLNAFSSTSRPKISHEKVLIEQTKTVDCAMMEKYMIRYRLLTG